VWELAWGHWPAMGYVAGVGLVAITLDLLRRDQSQRGLQGQRTLGIPARRVLDNQPTAVHLGHPEDGWPSAFHSPPSTRLSSSPGSSEPE
jgi:hypothetical protein